jgi:hypothetical protein
MFFPLLKVEGNQESTETIHRGRPFDRTTRCGGGPEVETHLNLISSYYRKLWI